MKLWAYRKQSTIEYPVQHSIHLYEREFSLTNGVDFLGTIDLDIQKPKKTVVKEAQLECTSYGLGSSVDIKQFSIPKNAKNIKCTYEIEE